MIDTRGAGMNRVSALVLHAGCARPSGRLGGHAVRQPTRTQVAALADRMAGAWRARHPDPEPTRAPLDAEVERRLQALDARMEHLEAALEGLQDALYRQARRGDEMGADLRRRTGPDRIARELSADARRRGL
jgi:PAS domain-containing protein